MKKKKNTRGQQQQRPPYYQQKHQQPRSSQGKLCKSCGRNYISATSSSCRDCAAVGRLSNGRYIENTGSWTPYEGSPQYPRHYHRPPRINPEYFLPTTAHWNEQGQFVPMGGGFAPPRPPQVHPIAYGGGYTSPTFFSGGNPVQTLLPIPPGRLPRIQQHHQIGTTIRNPSVLRQQESPTNPTNEHIRQKRMATETCIKSPDKKKGKRIVPGSSLSKMPKKAEKVSNTEANITIHQEEVNTRKETEELSTTEESEEASNWQEEDFSASGPLCRFEHLGRIRNLIRTKKSNSRHVSCQTMVDAVDVGTQCFVTQTSISTQASVPLKATVECQTIQETKQDNSCQTVEPPTKSRRSKKRQRSPSPEVIILDGPEQPRAPDAPPPRKFAPRRTSSDRHGTSSSPIDVTGDDVSSSRSRPRSNSTTNKIPNYVHRISHEEFLRQRAKEQEKLQSEQERLLNAARMRFMADLNSPPQPHWRSPDPYSVLGVSSNATFSSCRKAWRAMALKYHPDKCNYAYAREAFDACAKAWKAIEAMRRADDDSLS
mmetsp:Transcript_2860/g.3968  ORF Transcript_2860/g.3968 Transcript_2860/m.3968 type:complete len:542 (+) Transcript_2860:195-1820(+)